MRTVLVIYLGVSKERGRTGERLMTMLFDWWIPAVPCCCINQAVMSRTIITNYYAVQTPSKLTWTILYI
jgi:hypothetical protein